MYCIYLFFFLSYFFSATIRANLYECSTAIYNNLTPIEITEPDSGLDGIDCIYVINLKERPERWEHAKKTHATYNLHPNRIYAVNGWKLSQKQKQAIVDARVDSKTKELTGGEIGCLLSHLSVYEDALSRGFSVIWVCEDDICLNDVVLQIPNFLQEISELDPDWDLIYTDYTRFGAGEQRYRPEQTPFTPIDESISPNFARILGRYGTHSMIFSQKGLAKLLSYAYAHCFWSPIDLDLQYAGLREYCIKNSITSVASFFSDTQPWSPLRNN